MLRVVICCLLLLCSLNGFPADPSLRKPLGMLYAEADTIVDGAKVPLSIAVFEGSTIESPGNESALISLGSIASIKVTGATKITLHNSAVQLHSGSASVDTKTGYALRTECLNVQPDSSEPTLYKVTFRDKKALVRVEKGAVVVKATTIEVPVSQGKTAEVRACGKPNEVIILGNSIGVSDIIGVGGVGAISIAGPWIGRQHPSPSSPAEKADQ